MKPEPRPEGPARWLLDEEPLEGQPIDDDVDRCWGYENPVRHQSAHRDVPARPEPPPL